MIKMKVNPGTGEPVVDDAEYEKFKKELDEVRILDIPVDIHIAKPVSYCRNRTVDILCVSLMI